MSTNLKLILMDWENDLKESRNKAQLCLQKIIKTITLTECDLTKSKISIKVISCVCTHVNNGYDYYDIYVKLFGALTAFVDETHWKSYIGYWDYLFSVLVNKNQWNEAVKLTPYIKIIKPITTNIELLQTYFNIYKNKLSRLIYQDKWNENLKKNYFDIIIKLFQIVYEKNGEKEFLKFMFNIFEIRSMIWQIILKHFKDGKEFLDNFSTLLQNIKNYESIEEIFPKITSILIAILNIEFNKQQLNKNCKEISISCQFINCFNNNNMKKIENLKNYSNILNIYENLLYTYNNCQDNLLFNEELKKILKQCMKVLDRSENKKNELWFFDTIITLPEIFITLSGGIRNKINEENLIDLFKILNELFKLLKNLKYTKIINCKCNNINQHAIYNISYTTIRLYRRVCCDLNVKNSNIMNILIDQIQYVSIIYKTFQCENAYIILRNICAECLNVANLIKDEFYIEYTINLLDIIRKLKLKTELRSQFDYICIYKNLYSHTKNYRYFVQISALHIVYLLSKNSNQQYEESYIQNKILLCSKAYEKANYDYSLTICDILQEMNEMNEFDFEIPTYDKRKLLNLHLTIAIRYYPNEKFKIALVNRILNKTESDIDFAAIVNKIGNLSIPKLMERIECTINKLSLQIKNESGVNPNTDELHLSLGYLYKRLFIFKYERNRNVFEEKSITEKILNGIDCNQFKNVSISLENDIIECGVESLNNFSDYFEKSNNKNETTTTIFPDIIDCISYLARHFQLRGYFSYAYRSWKLIYKIATTINCILNKSRAIAFFLEYSEIVHRFENEFDIDEIIKNNSDDIIKQFENINLLTPRQQNYILICFLNLSRYYAMQNDFKLATDFINIVQSKLKEIDQRKDTFDLIAAIIYAIEFYIITRGGGGDGGNNNNNQLISPYIYGNKIMKEIKSVKYITSEDELNIPTFLFRIIFDIGEFFINRLFASGMKPYLYMMLRFGLEYGFTYRIAQTLIYLMHIDLQMESIKNCEIKLRVMDVLLEDSKFTKQIEAKSMQKEIVCGTPATSSSIFSVRGRSHHNYREVEPLRKVIKQQIELPPSIHIQQSESDNNLSGYFLKHNDYCKCNLCKNPTFKFISFYIGILVARYHYTMHDFKRAEIIYQEAFLWWKHYEINNPLKILYHGAYYWMLIYYTNMLRRAEYFGTALQICNIGMKYFEEHKSTLDIALFQNVVEQKGCIDYEINILAEQFKDHWKRITETIKQNANDDFRLIELLLNIEREKSVNQNKTNLQITALTIDKPKIKPIEKPTIIRSPAITTSTVGENIKSNQKKITEKNKENKLSNVISTTVDKRKNAKKSLKFSPVHDDDDDDEDSGKNIFSDSGDKECLKLTPLKEENNNNNNKKIVKKKNIEEERSPIDLKKDVFKNPVKSSQRKETNLLDIAFIEISSEDESPPKKVDSQPKPNSSKETNNKNSQSVKKVTVRKRIKGTDNITTAKDNNENGRVTRSARKRML